MFRKHTSILVDEVCEHLPLGAQNVVDGTAGHGGHIRAMQDCLIQQGSPNVKIFGIDKDGVMIDRLLTQQAAGERSDAVHFIHAPYDTLDKVLPPEMVGKLDYILLDIGINREHVIDAQRGFSIKSDGPLDMRFDTSKGKTAREYLMRVFPEDLSLVLQQYGDYSQGRADKIALHIVQQRRKSGLQTTNDLKKILKELSINDRKCAVVYQAIRIAVNDELGHVERFLQKFPAWLKPAGRCAIITFHSIEDRLVKHAFKKLQDQGGMSLVNKKAIQPSRQEKEKNRASRSAKLRIIQKESSY